MPETRVIKSFSTPLAWRKWLEKNHGRQDGIWLRLYKKASGKKGLTYAEALDEALCFGWIDGLVNKYDEISWIQKFTPRRPRSMWSKRNREHIARLIKEKRITEAGLKEVKRAKEDGRWDSAYDSPKTMQVPEDFLKRLKKDKKAFEFFKTLSKSNVYAIAWRLQTAKKPETRLRRMEALVSMLSAGKKLH